MMMMKTKYFMATLSKGIDSGMIEICVSATRYYPNGVDAKSECKNGCYGRNYGDKANIFNTSGNLRGSETLWDEGRGTAKDTSYQLFPTGAAAAKWIQEIRERLIILDYHVNHLRAEVEALKV
jgi:hypothetical protein